MGRVADLEDVAGTRGTDQLRRRHTADLVAEHLRMLVFTGVLRAGDKVPQDDIARNLGVSRLPVREAVLGMARDGLLVVQPHLGAFVGPFDPDVVRDHFEIVGLVQGLAAVRLAQDPEPDVLVQLGRLRDEIHAADDPGRVHDLTMSYHRTINLAGASDRQRSVLRALARMLPSGFFVQIPGAEESERRGVDAIHGAILDGDVDTVRRVFLQVQRARGELVVEYLRSQGVFEPASVAP